MNCIAFTGQVITVLTVVPGSKGYFASEWVGNLPITIDAHVNKKVKFQVMKCTHLYWISIIRNEFQVMKCTVV